MLPTKSSDKAARETAREVHEKGVTAETPAKDLPSGFFVGTKLQKPGGRLAALFLESEKNLCLAIGRLLAVSRPDIDPVFVSDGNQALDAIRDLHAEQRHLDVLVTDYAHPPGPDGAELIRWIRELPDDFTMRGGAGINQLPVVVVSGNRFADKARDVDPDVLLLRKPYKFEGLVNVIDVAIRQFRERSLSDLRRS